MQSTIDPHEVDNFEKVALQWWDVNGPFKPLHQINPVRMQYILDTCQTYFKRMPQTLLEDLEILDVGCGGGLITELLARLGAKVTGIDAGQEAIKVAMQHAQAQNLDIHYRCIDSEFLAQEGIQYDVITALEIIEHVADVQAFIQTLAKLLKPGGLLILSTLNRNFFSYALGIVAAEYILKWVPKGTHQWHKFLKPSEIAKHLRGAGFMVQETQGMTFNPLDQSWRLSPNAAVNYFMVARLCK